MKRRELWIELSKILQSTQATDDARQIVTSVCGCSHANFLAHPEQRVPMKAVRRAHQMARRRAQNVPMAYLLKSRAFFGRDFYVNKAVLIPRPETEMLVEEALTLPISDLVIDVGTGSGALSITLALEQSAPVIATDSARRALRVAKRNARRLNARVRYLRAHLLDHPVIANAARQASSVLVVANLPYLTPALLADSPREVTQYEPHLALIADDDDGLSLYRQLFQALALLDTLRQAQGIGWLCPEPVEGLLTTLRQTKRLTIDRRLTILFEIDPRQSNAARALAQEFFPNASVCIKKDLSGHARMGRIDIGTAQ